MRIPFSLKGFERTVDVKAEKFVWRHPFLGFLLIFVGMPIFILICVTICTALIAYPLSCLMGWI